VWQALTKLAPKQRAAIVMRYYLDMGEQEMAEQLSVAPGTVKWRLHQARQRLRHLLRGEWLEAK
jgi:RNA polymerase sigma factor (sigma-70 family)